MQLEIGECFESINDAVDSTVKALGGFKKVGPVLRPELPQEQAANWLRDCLNPTRRERLSPEQLMLIAKMARKAEYHALMNFIAFDGGYKAAPVDPQTQLEQLQERFCDAVEGLSAIQAQMQRLQRARAVA